MKFVRKLFRELLDGKEGIIAPCAYDALSARMIEASGFKLAGTTGYGMHGSILGCPDNGMLAFNEMVEACGKMADAVNIPLLADAEGGYGNAINVIRSVRDFEKAGMAGIFIEDQVLPPNCPFIHEPKIITEAEMVGKIEAAVMARCGAMTSRDAMDADAVRELLREWLQSAPLQPVKEPSFLKTVVPYSTGY